MAPVKSQKHRLTIGQLAAYDDILTDALVDHTYYWTTVPKNRQGYHPSRGLKEDDITKIIQSHIIVNKDMEAAEKHLLATPGLRQFLSRLKTENEKDDFKKHLRRYMKTYLPDCPFEVTTTNRYTITTHEASISARRLIKKGEHIKYLHGIQVVITPAEEQEIMARKKDFSIVVSSRHKHTCLFMGPARFANHDCDANARLVTCGQAGIEIVAERDIERDEEITVTYSENYFGEKNCECLCRTCEDNLINGWANPDYEAAKKTVDEGGPRAYSLRRRKRCDSSGPASRTSSIAPEIRPKIRRTKTRIPLASAERGSTSDCSVPESLLREKRRREVDSCLSSPPATPAKRQKSDSHTYALAPVVLPSIVSRSSSIDSVQKSTDGEQTDAVLTDATSPECEVSDPMLKTPDPSPIKGILPVIKSEDSVTSSAESLVSSIETPNIAAGLAEPNFEPMPNADENRRAKGSCREDGDDNGDGNLDSLRRVPGDYTLTPVLLSEPESAWIKCTICTHAFVQHNAYFTRRECPRCERHSKLYGYMWPKTDKEGKNDKEERVLDHRTIHRFLATEDERLVRGKVRAELEKLQQGWDQRYEVDTTRSRSVQPVKGKTTAKATGQRTFSESVILKSSQQDGGCVTTTTRSGRTTKRILRA